MRSRILVMSVMSAGLLAAGPSFAQVPYQGPGCGPAGYDGCGLGYQRPYAGPSNGPPGYRRSYRGYIPYQGPDQGPPGYYGRRGAYPRPYAGPGNGPPGYQVWRDDGPTFVIRRDRRYYRHGWDD
jgi:hypothetical protein